MIWVTIMFVVLGLLLFMDLTIPWISWPDSTARSYWNVTDDSYPFEGRLLNDYYEAKRP